VAGTKSNGPLRFYYFELDMWEPKAKVEEDEAPF
jgi:hypothetical protein